MVKVKLMADQGADADFILESLLETVIKNESFLKPKQYRLSQVYSNVTGDPCLISHLQIPLDVYLIIRYRTSLILRNIIRKVSKKKIRTVIIGRLMLESLRCDRSMLMAAHDKLCEDIEDNMRLKEDGNKKTKV